MMGLLAWGRCPVRQYGAAKISSLRPHFIEHILAPLLTGQDPTQIERLTASVNTAVANNPFTKAGIEMALWDILGKVAGLPLYRLLGGPVRDRVRTKFSVSGLAPDRAAGIAAWAVEQGFDTMKVKVGLDPAEDVARVAAVRQAVGPDVRLGVDANGGWSVRTAIQTIQQLYQYDIYFVILSPFFYETDLLQEPLPSSSQRRIKMWPGLQTCAVIPICRSWRMRSSTRHRMQWRSHVPVPG